jgi:hypothetical protein
LLFKEIKVIGVNEIRTHKPDSADNKYNVYFELSIVPPPRWREMLEKNSTKFKLDGRYIILQCLFSEIEEMLSDAKKEVVRTNLKYKEFLLSSLKYDSRTDLLNKNNNDEQEKLKFYFIKDVTIHKYPPIDTHVTYDGQKLYGTPPNNYTKCKKCFKSARAPD